MANSTITNFPTEKTNVPDGSYIGFDWFNGTGNETVKILSENFANSLGTKHYLNTNLVNTTGARSHDHGEYDMFWGKVRTFRAEATAAPTGENASFNFKGWGVESDQIVFREESTAGVIRESYGNKSQKIFGAFELSTSSQINLEGKTAYLSASSGSNGFEIGGNGGTHFFNWNNAQYRATGNLDENSIIHENTSANSYFAQVNPGGSTFRVGRTGNNGSIFLGVGGSFTQTELITFLQADGTTLFNLPSVGIGATSVSASAALQVDSTTQGVLVPRVTEVEMNAITPIPVGLNIYNITRGESMHYHNVFGWIGCPLSIMMGTAPQATVTSTTYYFSTTQGLGFRSTIAGLAIRPIKKGKIIAASFTRYISSTLGNRSYSLYIRINDTTDYLVATEATTAVETFFSNSAINTTGIPVDVTDSIVMKLVVSGGTTDSTNVLFYGNLLIR